MTVRIFRNYWQLPMVVLAGLELLVFAGGFYLAANWRFDRDYAQVMAIVPGGVFFTIVMSLSMASMVSTAQDNLPAPLACCFVSEQQSCAVRRSSRSFRMSCRSSISVVA